MLQPVDPTNDRPVYKQIADQLRAAIEAGRLAPGERLPSEAELMSRYDVAQGTVRQGISLLRGEGLVVAQQGRGVFVRERPRLKRLASDRFSRKHREAGKAAYLAESEAEGVRPGVEVYYVGPGEASPDIADRLGIRKGTRVLIRRRRYLSDGQPPELAVGNWLFLAPEGGPLRESNWKRSVNWTKAREAIGVPSLRVHDLRHTAASIWLGQGADPKVVQRVLGHATAAMTMDLYGHLLDANLWAAAQRIGDISGTSSGPTGAEDDGSDGETGR